MTRATYKEKDCTNVLSVPFQYDRMTELGVPYENPRWKAHGHRNLYNQLGMLGEFLQAFGYFKSEHAQVKSVLTGGLYVNKPGWHGRGQAVDFDGFQMEDGTVHLYKPGVDTIVDGIRIKSMSRVLACRIAASISLFFGLVLTWNYNSRHYDHIHFDLGYPVGWRKPDPFKKQSQIILLQEILVHCYNRKLITIDGRFGSRTQAAWLKIFDLTNRHGATEDWVNLHDLWHRTINEVANGTFKNHKGGSSL